MKRTCSMSSLITVISLLLGVIWLSPSLAVAAPTFASLGQITAVGLRVPGAMDLDGAGNLYVADARGGLVHKFSPYGRLLQSFDLQASGRGLAVTPDGARLYVSREDSVVIVNVTGDVVDTLTGAAANGPEFSVAGEIDIDAAGNVFVADAGSMQVKVYDASGQYRSRFGAIGVNAGQFTQMGGMAISPTGKVVVADTSSVNGKVQVYTMNTDLSVAGVVAYSKLSTANFGTPYLHAPRGLTFDAQGRGYFLEFMTSQVRVTSAGFGYLGAYTVAGDGVGQLNNVTDVIFDNANSRLFVGCDTGRIEILGVDGGQSPVYVNHAPTSPVLQSPVAGSEVDSVNPALVINNATDEDGDALTYKVVVSQAGTVLFEAEVPAETGDTTTVIVDVALAENEAFTWTAQANDGEALSVVSAPATFIVNAVEEAPSVPELSAPLNGESIDGLETLSWSVSTDPDPNDKNISYQVEVAVDEAFAQLVAEGSLTDTTLALGSLAAYGDLADGTRYFWRVTAMDDGQTKSAPSAAGQFVYDTTALTVKANMPDALVSFHGNHVYPGQIIGSAPIELRDLSPGSLSVVVERAGFEPFVAPVSLADGENVTLYAELVPSMTVSSLSPSRNGINGRSGLAVSSAAVPFLVDYDNDGDLDLLVGDGSGQITLFANMQMAGRNRLYFDQGVSLGLPVLPAAVPFVADWNNDGRKDLLVGQLDGSVKLFVNVGLEEAPAFAAGVDLQTVNGALNAGSHAAPAVADYNGDGSKDLLVGNASGQVLVYLNQGTDAAPLLTVPVAALQVSDAVVPMPVDWDADGQQELLLTAGGVTTVYAKVDGVYQAGQSFGDRRANYIGAFALDLDGTGKQLLLGQNDGQLAFMTGNSIEPVASFHVAMQDKVDELGGLVALSAPELLDEVAVLSAMVSAADYYSAALAADELALKLEAGAAQDSALELAKLCR